MSEVYMESCWLNTLLPQYVVDSTESSSMGCSCKTDSTCSFPLSFHRNRYRRFRRVLHMRRRYGWLEWVDGWVSRILATLHMELHNCGGPNDGGIDLEVC